MHHDGSIVSTISKSCAVAGRDRALSQCFSPPPLTFERRESNLVGYKLVTSYCGKIPILVQPL